MHHIWYNIINLIVAQFRPYLGWQVCPIQQSNPLRSGTKRAVIIIGSIWRDFNLNITYRRKGFQSEHHVPRITARDRRGDKRRFRTCSWVGLRFILTSWFRTNLCCGCRRWHDSLSAVWDKGISAETSHSWWFTLFSRYYHDMRQICTHSLSFGALFLDAAAKSKTLNPTMSYIPKSVKDRIWWTIR